MNRICKKCNTEKDNSEFSDMKRKNKPISKHSYCKSCLQLDTLLRRRKFKLECLKYKGFKCEICGYHKSEAALDFHHKDPSQKDFNISKIRTCSFEKNKTKIVTELDKCILLCSNCHRELHYNQIQNIELTSKVKVLITCIDCDKIITKKNARCIECSIKYRNIQSKRPSKEQLIQDISDLKCNMSAIGRKYNVSDNSIRKWIKSYSIIF